jgi:hypothetical protein
MELELSFTVLLQFCFCCADLAAKEKWLLGIVQYLQMLHDAKLQLAFECFSLLQDVELQNRANYFIDFCKSGQIGPICPDFQKLMRICKS